MAFEPEELTAQIDGTANTFTTTFFRVLAQLVVFYNGSRLPPTMFTEPNSKEIELGFVPAVGDTLLVLYKTDETVDGRVQGFGEDPSGTGPTVPQSLDDLLAEFDDRLDFLESKQDDIRTNPVLSIRYIGNDTVANLNALAGSLAPLDAGKTFVVTDTGTLAVGTLSVDPGDAVEWSGTTWTKLIAGVGGFTPFGARLVVSTTPGDTLQAPLVDGTDNGKLAQFGGSSNTPSSFSLPAAADLVFVKAGASAFKNDGFIFDGVIPTGQWVQFTSGGGGPVPAGSAQVRDFGFASVGQTVFLLPVAATDVLAFLVGGVAQDKGVGWTFTAPSTITFIPAGAGFTLDASDPVEAIFVAA